MNKLFRILPITLVLFSISVIAQAQNAWIGDYTFEEDGGKNAGGSAIFISHELKVFEGDGGALVARLQSNGYQTSSDLVCTTKLAGEKLVIYFESYGEDNMFEPYKPGDLLFTLERKIEKGKAVVLTHWGKFTPSIPRNSKSGKVYFQRAATGQN
jgi:hypothetical protein